MNDTFYSPETAAVEPIRHSRWQWPMAAVLAVAVGGNGFLLVRSNHLSNEITAVRDSAATQISKLNAASDATQEEYRKRLASLSDSLSTYHHDSSGAVARVRAEAKKQTDQLTQKIEQQQHELTGELSEVKTAADTANAKVTEVSSEVGNVKTDVSGVKTDVTGVRTELASAQNALHEHAAELKRVVGDMGAMSGLIATNSKDLSALRELGERNYYEFILAKGQTSKKVGDMILTLKKADAKNNRFTLEVTANDKRVEKKDRTVNEPVQVYFEGDRIPHEIVVNKVKKDQIVGYLAVPKVTLSQR